MAQRIIDTHVHVWNFDKADYTWLEGNTTVLNRTYHLNELETERETAGVTEGVLVQAAVNSDDTNWMLDVAKNNDWIKGVVCWLPLMQPEKTAALLAGKYGGNSYVKGVRHLIHDESDPAWLLQDEVIESLKILAQKDLPYDVVGVLPEHIETVLKVAEKVPTLRMVFDHLNHPPIASNQRFGRWGDLMKEAAKNPLFHAKISGLGTVVNRPLWGAEDIKPYVAFALEQFGTARCFCGGDWPVSLLAGSYTKTWQIYRDVIDALVRESDREKVYADNAVAFYGL